MHLQVLRSLARFSLARTGGILYWPLINEKIVCEDDKTRHTAWQGGGGEGEGGEGSDKRIELAAKVFQELAIVLISWHFVGQRHPLLRREKAISHNPVRYARPLVSVPMVRWQNFLLRVVVSFATIAPLSERTTGQKLCQAKLTGVPSCRHELPNDCCVHAPPLSKLPIRTAIRVRRVNMSSPRSPVWQCRSVICSLGLSVRMVHYSFVAGRSVS